ncbi:MAG: MopE-related protein, partial [Myxococcota bacterium]|nr:MopE-related protein [Myxococcota bacterium]
MDCDGLVQEDCPDVDCRIFFEDRLGLRDGGPPEMTRACGPPSPTQGACRFGRQRCHDDGRWSAVCEGAVYPEPERCGNGIDDDCDGLVDPPHVCDCTAAPEICANRRDDDCDGRVDELDGCTPSCETRCDGTCVDPRLDERHCGRCGNACPPTDLCVDGACRRAIVQLDGYHALLSDGRVRTWSTAYRGGTSASLSLPPVTVPGITDGIFLRSLNAATGI